MTIALASVLDTPAAGPLRLTLERLIAQNVPIQADGEAVERIGLACLQVLAAGQVAAIGVGLDFKIVGSSPALIEMATLAGLATLVTV